VRVWTEPTPPYGAPHSVAFLCQYTSDRKANNPKSPRTSNIEKDRQDGGGFPLVKMVKFYGGRSTQTPVFCIGADPDNADWIKIVRAERIARQVPDGQQIWKTAIEKAGGNRSEALAVFYRFLREAGIPEID